MVFKGEEMSLNLNSIEEALGEIKKGKMIIVVDDDNRENEGDLLMAAECVTDQAINFMASYGKGLICMPAEKKILDHLEIFDMVQNNTDNHQTAFTVSIDHINTSTGISAADRALTIKEIFNPLSTPSSFRRPGHIFPLVAKHYGVLERPGHTEAAVDLAKMAGFQGVGVICEIMNDDGTMMRGPDLKKFAEKHGLVMISIEDLIEYRKKYENQMIREVVTTLPTPHGEFQMYGYRDSLTGMEHIALVKGELSPINSSVLVRIHSECLTGDVFGSKRCDCGEQLEAAMKLISEKNQGVILYLRQEGRGIGLLNKLKAYVLQDQGLDTVEANIELGFDPDLRDFSIAAQILKDLNIHTVDLMTNNVEKIDALNEYGISVNQRIPIQLQHNEYNKFYLQTKKNKLNHLLKFTGE